MAEMKLNLPPARLLGWDPFFLEMNIAVILDFPHCWTWIGSIDVQGQPAILVSAPHTRNSSHAVSLPVANILWALSIGTLEPGEHLQRRCKNPRCVRHHHHQPVDKNGNPIKG